MHDGTHSGNEMSALAGTHMASVPELLNEKLPVTNERGALGGVGWAAG